MKLIDVVLFVSCFVLFVIGTHQAMVVGIAESYWIFMFSLAPLFLYNYRKNRQEENAKKMKTPPAKKPKKRKYG